MYVHIYEPIRDNYTTKSTKTVKLKYLNKICYMIISVKFYNSDWVIFMRCSLQLKSYLNRFCYFSTRILEISKGIYGNISEITGTLLKILYEKSDGY